MNEGREIDSREQLQKAVDRVVGKAHKQDGWAQEGKDAPGCKPGGE